MTVEVTNVSPHGSWLLVGDVERFVSFKVFPWSLKASIGELTNVELPSPHHLYWPDLDIDLAVDSLDNSERYPLVSRARPSPTYSRTGAPRRRRPLTLSLYHSGGEGIETAPAPSERARVGVRVSLWSRIIRAGKRLKATEAAVKESRAAYRRRRRA